MRAFQMQCKAETIRILRNPYFVFWSLLMPIVFYIIFTKVFNTNIQDKQEWQAHYLMSMTAFSVMGSAIMTLGIRIVEERTKGWSVFMRITPLSDQAFFAAKMIGQTVIHLFSILIIFLAGALINQVTLTAFEWLMSGLWILLGSLPFLALGTLVGTMKRVDTASGVSNVIYMILAISGGMWMPMEIMPSIIQKIGVWLPSYNLGNGAWEIIRGNSPEWGNFLILLGYFFLFVLLSSYIRRKQEAAV
ncbi:ABC transporter permease [Cytobacillus praedii]|uniref:ABC transporter permease n=1 Tax=Cytobacillus praedii TaxID=1742358 RepID=A0A4V2NU76_9BACI|nr:ABC transporter permease [Cytobacillus praedii]MED3553803.1 ABC transporter permease [Cytobacillus praedii]MED3571666.1 ABC transporter permease [Cytobacillus praedii]TCJ03271.1 ABC transporter permease [Cytobacillus praedii]